MRYENLRTRVHVFFFGINWSKSTRTKLLPIWPVTECRAKENKEWCFTFVEEIQGTEFKGFFWLKTLRVYAGVCVVFW